MRIPIEALPVEIGLVRQVFRDQQRVWLEALYLIGQTQREPVIHIIRVRGVEAEAIEVILRDEQLAGINEHVLHIGFLGGQAVAPWRRAVEIQTAFVRAVFFVRMFEDELPKRIEIIAGMIEHLVEQHGETLGMRSIDEFAQVIGRAEVAFDCAENRGIVAECSPPSRSGNSVSGMMQSAVTPSKSKYPAWMRSVTPLNVPRFFALISGSPSVKP